MYRTRRDILVKYFAKKLLLLTESFQFHTQKIISD